MLTSYSESPKALTTSVSGDVVGGRAWGGGVSDNFKVYESKWAFEKAKTVVINNPSLLQVQTTGYGIIYHHQA
jgi:hypothetical protein